MNIAQQTAFIKDAAWQLAYSLLFLGKQAKLFKQDGQWYCKEVKDGT